VIRFSAFLVAVAVGLLVAGVVTSRLLLVYIAIGVSGVALLVLGVGALVKRRELFGEAEKAGPEPARPEPASVRLMPQPEHQVAPWEATVAAGSGPGSGGPAAPGWPAAPAGPSRAGYLPAERPVPIPGPAAPPPAARPVADVQRPPAAFAPRPAASAPSPAPSVWERRHDAPPAQPPAGPPPAQPPAGPPPAQPPAGPPPAPPPVGSPPGQPPAGFRPPQPPPGPPRPASVPPDALAAAAAAAVAGAPAAPLERPQPPTDERPSTDEQLPTDDRAAAPGQAAPGQAAPGQAAPGHLPGKDQPAEPQQSAEPEQSSEPQQPAEPKPPAQPQNATEPEQVAPAAPTSEAPASPRATDPPSATADLQREVTVVPGVPRYHKAHCILIRFMGENDLDKMTLGAAREAGCTPCRACLPDQPGTNPELSGRGSSPEPEREDELGVLVLPRSLARRPGTRTSRINRTGPVVHRQHLAGDQLPVLGQRRGHVRVA
jgi:hypothetical protein